MFGLTGVQRSDRYLSACCQPAFLRDGATKDVVQHCQDVSLAVISSDQRNRYAFSVADEARRVGHQSGLIVNMPHHC